jgi:hypothetical protein
MSTAPGIARGRTGASFAGVLAALFFPRPRGYCLTCQRLFAVDMVELMLERGWECPVVGMKPLTCPGCEGKRTQFSITTPGKVRPCR